MKYLSIVVLLLAVGLGSVAHAQADKSAEKISGGVACLITGYIMLAFPTGFAFANGDAAEDRLTAQFWIPVVGPVATVHRLPPRHPLRADGREYVLAYSSLLIQLEGVFFIVWGILERRAARQTASALDTRLTIAPAWSRDIRGVTMSFRF